MRTLLRCGAALALALAAVAVQAQVYSAKKGIYSGGVSSTECPDPLAGYVSDPARIKATCVSATEYERRRLTVTLNGCFSAFPGTRDPNGEDLSSVEPNVTYRTCPACIGSYCNAACTISSGGYGGPSGLCPGGQITRPVCNIQVHASNACGPQRLSWSKNRGGYSCGVIEAVWDVPAGAAVFYEFAGDDPIQQVIKGVEEQYAHVVLSLGDKGIAHATGQMANHRKPDPPDLGDMKKACDYPLWENELRYMAPGVEIVNFGAMLAQGSATGGKWRASTQGTKIANWALNEAPRTTVTSSVGYPGATYTRLLRSNTVIPYGLYQYTNIQTTHLGKSSTASQVDYNGMVCSTFMAWAQASAEAGVIEPYTYSHAQLANQLNFIHTYVKDQCVQRMYDSGTSANWVDDRCFLSDRGVCTAAANQITNCFVTPTGCGLNGSYWKNTRDNPNATAWSISPDRIGGVGPRHANVNSTWSGAGAGPEQTPRWNAAGLTYGCWR